MFSSERVEKLHDLQQEKIKLFLEIKRKKYRKSQQESLKNAQRRMNIVQKEMADLNKLEEKEKNIHVIWIGVPPKGEFNNLKVWTKYDPEYKIHIWTDSTHILTHKLNSIISENSKKINNGVQEHDYLLEAKLKDEFYNKYQLKNFGKTFDENVQQFLLDKGYAKEDEITAWIKDGKEKIIQEQEDIKKYTLSEVILHDVSKEKDGIFPNKEYDEGYLKTLEHLHLCAGASDRLRYAILNKFGGVYLDTDVMPKFNLEKIKANQEITDLVNEIEWDETEGSIFNKKLEIIINQMIIFDNLKQLDEETLKDFAENWSRVLEGDCEKNFEILKEIAEKFKSMNLSFNPEMKLSEFPITNFLQVGCCVINNGFANAFLVSKENTNFLQELMKKIEVTDEKIKDMKTYKKLINKDNMIINHTGPGNLCYTILENDDTYLYALKSICSKITDFESNINSLDSSWFNSTEQHKDALEDLNALKRIFWSSKAEVTNYELRKQLENASLTEKEEDFQKPTTSSDFQFEKDELSF